MKLYLALISASLRSQLSYPGSFALGALGSFLVTVIEAVGVWALFDRFGNLQGWTLAEVALIYGQVNVSFAIADGLAAGFDQVNGQIRRGDFDRVLLRPRSTVVLVLGEELALRRVGRLLQGCLVLAWGLGQIALPWGSALLLGWAVVGTTSLFLGLFVLKATAAFWTVESLEVFNAFSYGGAYAAQYPMSIYAGWFRRLFTYGVPLSLVSYFPMIAVLGRDDPLGSSRGFQMAAPLGGVVFLALAFGAWHLGVRRYTSTGS